jgi:RNA polymerase sigma factor (sigma-70 family)
MYSEEKIIKGCRKKDPFFQRVLYEKSYSKMLGLCMRYSKDMDEAKDILHDGFIKVFEKFKSFNRTGSLEGWVARIIRNTAIDYSRKNSGKFTELPDEKLFDEPDSSAFEEGLKELSPEEVIGLFQWLPTGYRTVLNMYAIEKMSHSEIAKELDISVNTSKTQLFKARKMLRSLVEKKQKELYNETGR